MTITVSETVKPPGDASFWERGLDPFHVNCFEGFNEDIKSQLRAMAPGPQRGGWFLLDAYGQEIGFVPDGTECEVPE